VLRRRRPLAVGGGHHRGSSYVPGVAALAADGFAYSRHGRNTLDGQALIELGFTYEGVGVSRSFAT